MADCLRLLGLLTTGNFYPPVYRHIEKFNISTVHWVKNGGKGRRGPPLEEVMTKESSYSRGSLKRRLLEEGLLQESCAECDILPEWNGRKLVFVLDHVNGVNNDHRLKNLRLLCPNCNSQTSTFSGRNVKK